MAASPLLAVQDLRKHFALKRRPLSLHRRAIRAVDDVSFVVRRGETLGVVGESGCGKSTLARVLVGLIAADRGEVRFDGRPVPYADGAALAALRRGVQMVFQDSYASLNPKLSVRESVAFTLWAQGVATDAAARAADAMLDLVGLPAAEFAQRYPHELSGGQRQRVNIARALVVEPQLVILDEPVSALDKSVQAQVLNLLSDLKERLGLTLLFISHDLGVVEYLSDRVIVMYLGRIVEEGPTEAVFARPRHPYTQALFAAMPSLDPDRRTETLPISGDPPSPVDLPSGCRFRSRCAHAEAVCAGSEPGLIPAGADDHRAACLIVVPGSGHSLSGRGQDDAA